MLAHYVLARRIMARLLLLVLATLGAAAAKDDPLRSALMMQTKEKLFEIAQKAGIHGYDEDTDIDTMRKLVYEHAQHEKPAGVERKRWDGTDMPADAAPQAKAAPAAAKAAPAAAKAAPASSMDGMSSKIFAKFDANQDGKLSREEMQPMLDATNAAAKAKGEAVPDDFFGTLDKDKVSDPARTRTLAVTVTLTLTLALTLTLILPRTVS